MEKNSSSKKVIIGITGAFPLVVLCVVMLIIWKGNKETPQDGLKSIVVQVTSERDKYSLEKSYETDCEYLGELLVQEELIGYNETEYGKYITSVLGFESKDEEQSWWCVMVNGESAVTGIDEIAIEDGATYSLELKIGW